VKTEKETEAAEVLVDNKDAERDTMENLSV